MSIKKKKITKKDVEKMLDAIIEQHGKPNTQLSEAAERYIEQIKEWLNQNKDE